MDAARRALANYPGLAQASCSPLGSGLINETFLVEHEGGRWVLQRVNPIFSPRIHENILAVTEHLNAAGLATPRLTKTVQGQTHLDGDDGVWRLMTHVKGVSFDVVQDPAQARSAGSLVGSFHRALDSLDHDFVDMRVGVHDTPAHLQRLRNALATHPDHALHAAVEELGASILSVAEALEALPAMPDRICHGDLKLNNIMFAGENAPDRDRAVCLIDLDTVGPMHLAYELGDAMRSWCNRGGEDAAGAAFDLDVFQAACEGYVAGLGRPLHDAEVACLIGGVDWVSLELAARFAADALLESYFGWDPRRFKSRGEHNLVRARGQWAMHERARDARGERARRLDTTRRSST